MAGLLQDNIALDSKHTTAHSDGLSADHLKSSKKRELTEDVHGLLSWIECFNVYSSVLMTKYPSLAKALIAYGTMIRQHAAIDPTSADWARLNSALYAISFLSRQKGESQTCPNCMISDHSPIHCALARREETSNSSSFGQHHDYTGQATIQADASRSHSCHALPSNGPTHTRPTVDAIRGTTAVAPALPELALTAMHASVVGMTTRWSYAHKSRTTAESQIIYG